MHPAEYCAVEKGSSGGPSACPRQLSAQSVSVVCYGFSLLGFLLFLPCSHVNKILLICQEWKWKRDFWRCGGFMFVFVFSCSQ